MVESQPNEGAKSTNHFASPWLEEDMTVETQRFVDSIDRGLIEFMLEKAERLGKEDVEQQDRRFVDPFICPICLSISFKSVQCGGCKQIFHRSCISQWLQQGGSKCSQCQVAWSPEEQNRNLNNIIDQIRIKCKHCDQVYQLQDRFSHIKQCNAITVVGCPSNSCASSSPKSFRQLRQHMSVECSSETLLCKGCGFNTFQHYSQTSNLHHASGHNCMRDLPNSPLLIRNMRNMVRKVNSKEITNLESELVLYKGPIPYKCVPGHDEPDGFFNVEQQMNMTEELVECCKQFLVRALRKKGYTKDAASSVIDDLEAIDPSKHWRVMIMTRQQLNAMAGRASCNGHYLKMTFRKGGVDFSVQIQQVV